MPSDHPIAVVGMACRFPGADDLDAFWRRLEAGDSTIREGVPGSGAGRVGFLFPDAADLPDACRFGSYLDEVDLFDAAFFRISPIEAQLLDPQQRLMLETCWRALEDAGIDPEGLKGSRTGVYAGISNNEYRTLLLDASDGADPAASLYAVSGTSYNTAIGRVSFALGLQGPAIALDTACSSSLVAVHQAVAGLQRGEADMALAGGVHVILSGRLMALRAKAGMLAPDGLCKTFDEAADGYVRGEGCGILVLKRLADAEADGDRIWGVIRGSALNQDGASAGLTVPNGEAQQKVIEDALRDAGLEPHDVDYVEAHGTGTPVGDPIEMNATGAAYSRGRTAERPILIGSVKTNVGHLEAAAGSAGLIKVILAMKRRVIPKHLNFNTPNPAIDWDALTVHVTTEKMDWPTTPGQPPRAGVSGFGWSGTNAHIVVEGYGEPESEPSGAPIAASAALNGAAPRAADRQARLLPLAGKTRQALRDLAACYAAWLDAQPGRFPSDAPASGDALSDLAWTASVGRAHFPHRAAMPFRDAASLRAALQDLADAPEEPDAPEPRAPSKIAFLYTGQGSQWPGMGQALYETEPVFRAVLDRCDAALRQARGASLLDVMFGEPGAAGSLDDPAWTQPAMYALECALTALWDSVGVRPDVVMGHSLGEIAAAHAAGAFSLEDGLRFAAARGELMASLPVPGAMAALFVSPEEADAAVKEWNAASGGPDLSVAAYNGAHQVVSGEAQEVERLAQRFESQGVRVSRLRSGAGYHSALVEPALDGLAAAADSIPAAPPALPLVSNVTGRPMEPGAAHDAAYWRKHARRPVAFSRSVETLAEMGVDAVIEIGPHAVLGPMTELAWPGAQPPAVLASLRRPPKEQNAPPADASGGFLEGVGAAFAAGLPIAFRALFAGEERRRVSLPEYPFQRQPHWVDAPKQRRSAAGHPLLGVRHDSPRGETLFETELAPADPPWLSDHRVFGRVIAPGALYGAMAASAPLSGAAVPAVVEDMQLVAMLALPEQDAQNGAAPQARSVQVVFDAQDETAARGFEIFSRGADEEAWTLHATGRVSPGAQPASRERVDLDALKARMAPQDVPAFYRARAEANVELGPAFRTLQTLWRGENEAVGEVLLPAALDGAGMAAHPIVLDGCFQVMSAARAAAGAGEGTAYLPFGWERLRLEERLPERVICHARMRESPQDAAPDGAPAQPREVFTADLRFYSPDGVELGELIGQTVKRATRAALASGTGDLSEMLYEMAWRERPLAGRLYSADALPAPSAVAADARPFADYLAAEGVGTPERAALLTDLELLARAYALRALDRLGYEREAGALIDPDALRERLQVLPLHAKLFERMLRLLADADVLARAEGGGYRVVVASGDPLPHEALADPEAFGERMSAAYPHGVNELGLLVRSGGALAEVLRGETDPLSILFPSEGPGLMELYFTAPGHRSSNRLLGDAAAAVAASWPNERRLRIVEVGAGTGSGTAVVLPELPAGNFDYTYTDISAGFFAQAESRFSDSGAPIDYRPLDVERDPASQGFEPHAYDLVIAVNVLHATRDLQETLTHCRELLAPSGQLIALENFKGRGWQDMVLGQLDGWWRYADAYRPAHALASPEVWLRALADSGFEDAAALGADDPEGVGVLGSGVLLARGPAEITHPEGVWLVAPGGAATARELADGLAARNQTVILAADGESESGAVDGPGVFRAPIDVRSREAWRDLLERLPKHAPLQGVAHCFALEGHGLRATTEQMAEDVRNATASALALTQALQDSGLEPARGLWFLTRGAQAIERDYMRESAGELSGAALWGFGKAIAREAAYLRPRMLDLDPDAPAPADDLLDELMFADAETHVAFRSDKRLAARLVRYGADAPRVALPEREGWRFLPNAEEGLDGLRLEPPPARPLESGEVRVAIEAVGLNFADVLIALGAVELDALLGEEFCGRVTETAPDVAEFAVGDRVLGLGIGTLQSETVVNAGLIAHAPAGVSAAALATVPTSFASAEVSFGMSGLHPGDRVLVHTASGGVGLAAVQLAQAAGAEVFATASAPKQAYLRSLGVARVYDSRTTDFAQRILEDTQGAGVTVVLNSLTGPGFIEAGLACLAPNGRFVEMSRRDIWTAEQMAAARPDAAYSILVLDDMKRQDPAAAGASVRRIMTRLAGGELRPLPHTRRPLTEIVPALDFMRSARHVGKIVLAVPPLAHGALRADRTYLVTGGMGGIGILVAEWLAEHGAGAIVLNGRRPPDAAAETAVTALRERGADVRVELADVTDAAAVGAMLERIDATLPPLGGVIHSVGALSDAALTNQTWERFEQVLWPKMLGAWQLHQATLNRDLDMFVLFSSGAGVLGSPGQANHSAANAFLDQLAAHRRALGLPGQSIAWGAWAEVGEAAEARERIEARLAIRGSNWFTPEQGMRAFDAMVRQDPVFAMFSDVDWQAFRDEDGRHPPLLDEILAAPEEDAADDASASSAALSGLWEALAAEREQMLSAFLRRELQAVMRLPTPPAATVEFSELGMDSLMAVELRNRMNRAFAGQYVAPNTIVFDYPSVAALAQRLAGELGAPAEASAPEPAAPEPPPAQAEANDGVAIVGMACRFPGAENLDAFWRQLTAGDSAVADRRADCEPLYGAVGDPNANGAPVRVGFVKDIDKFDSRFFRIAPIEARLMDPQQRMMLETSWEALEDAGIDPEALRGSRTGVYAGVGGTEYRDVVLANGRFNSYLGTTGSVTVGRVAFALGLEGPAVPVDVACASALAAMHQAVESLRRGEVDLALAGGVNVVLSPTATAFMADLGILSANGECRPFDADADGFVRGEGCGVIALKRLSDAEADGDRIWGVIRGSAVNQNGASMGLTVPRGPAQERVMEDALARGGVRPAEVDYLEAHVVGSNMADPIEVRAAAAVYGRGREAERPLLMGSVKANLGHLESAAGVASLIKAVLAMERGVIPKQPHVDNLNPGVEWGELPVRVASAPTEWPPTPGRPRRAGVSAFGLSGTNAHVVVEDYGEAQAAEQPNGSPAGASLPVAAAPPEFAGNGAAPDAAPTRRETRLLPLSGKTPAALRDLAARHAAWLDDQPLLFPPGAPASEAPLADLAWTASVGRAHFAHRTALPFHDGASLRDALQALAQAESPPDAPEPRAPSTIAFVYAGEVGAWAEAGAALYEREPVFRAVLDRCDAVMRDARGASLLDALFGAPGGLDDAAWARPAAYAMQCALTALWASVGVRPSAVMACGGAGDLAAAQAAGALSLEDGLRLAADGAETSFAGAPVSLVNAAGRLVAAGEALGAASEPPAFAAGAGALAELGVDALIEVGAGGAAAQALLAAWPRSDEGAPTALPGLAAAESGGFAEAVGGAYAAGLRVSLAGLFAGESRRRVAAPTYPFQRRRHWIEPLGAGEQAAG